MFAKAGAYSIHRALTAGDAGQCLLGGPAAYITQVVFQEPEEAPDFSWL